MKGSQVLVKMQVWEIISGRGKIKLRPFGYVLEGDWMVLVIAGRFQKCWPRIGQTCTHEFWRVFWPWSGFRMVDESVSE